MAATPGRTTAICAFETFERRLESTSSGTDSELERRKWARN
jgi:hypothetical protein